MCTIHCSSNSVLNRQKKRIVIIKMKFLNVFLILTIFVLKCSSEEIPSFIHVCHKDDPNMKECFIGAAEELRPYLVKGVPEYHIPSIEPLIMGELISEESAGLTITANNVKAYGCSDYFIRHLNIDLDKQTYEIDVELPLLRIEAQYTIAGKLVLMPVKGNGPMEANVTSCHSKTFLQGELYEKDGETHLRYTNMSMKVNVGGGQVKVENLFNGDKLLNDIVNETVNKNLDAFLKELLPVIERALSSTFLNIANKIVERFTFKQLFPH